MRLYLDLCALKRPFDAPREDRVLLEALAVASILDQFEKGKVEAVASPVLELENSRNPDAERRVAVEDVLSKLTPAGYAGQGLGARAAELHALGFDPLDALHLATAEEIGCDQFVTCDDRIIRLARRVAASLRLRVVDPLEVMVLLKEIEEP